MPNLIHDMKNPRQADRVCEVAYGVSMVIYLLVAVFGYVMYGTDVSDEVSKDLARTPGFSPLLNRFAVLMVAVSPLTKIPLGIQPVSRPPLLPPPYLHRPYNTLTSARKHHLLRHGTATHRPHPRRCQDTAIRHASSYAHLTLLIADTIPERGLHQP